MSDRNFDGGVKFVIKRRGSVITSLLYTLTFLISPIILLIIIIILNLILLIIFILSIILISFSFFSYFSFYSIISTIILILISFFFSSITSTFTLTIILASPLHQLTQFTIKPLRLLPHPLPFISLLILSSIQSHFPTASLLLLSSLSLLFIITNFSSFYIFIIISIISTGGIQYNYNTQGYYYH